VRASVLCGDVDGKAAGPSDETRVAPPPVPAFPDKNGELERRGMGQGRTRERGLDRLEVEASVDGDEHSMRETATEDSKLTIELRARPLGNPLASAGGLLGLDLNLDLDWLPLPFKASWSPDDDWGDPPPLRFRLSRRFTVTQP